MSWLRSKLPTLRPSTRRHYADVLDQHILPAFGDVYLDALTATDVVGWRDAMDAAPDTINGRLRVLKSMLADVMHERGMHNPAARVSSVRVSRHARRRKTKVVETSSPRCPAQRLTAAELAAVLEQLRELTPQWYPLVLTLAVTGARWGEATALKWSNVDFEAGLIRIEDAHWRGHIDETKTSVIKELPLPRLLAQVLKAHRRALVERQAKGLSAGWVFPSRVGRPHVDASVIRKPLAKALDAASVGRWVSPHGLRRSFNNLARQVAAGDVVRAMTGHVTEEMTTHYSHVELEEKRTALDGALRLVLGGGESDQADGMDTSMDTSADGTKKPG
ncbi:MAG: site-specific integrase [Sandaracinaceae bacterium]